MTSKTDLIRSEIYDMISSSDCHRKSREFCRDFFLNNREYLPILLNFAFNVNDQFYFKACWTLELVVENDIEILFPYVNDFSNTLPIISHDGALRSISKICLMLARNHIQKLKTDQIVLTENQLKIISESCFMWLVGDDKVATKAYAMRALFEIGKIQPWILPQLKEIIEHGYSNHSPAYKAASKDILKKLSKQPNKSLL